MKSAEASASVAIGSAGAAVELPSTSAEEMTERVPVAAAAGDEAGSGEGDDSIRGIDTARISSTSTAPMIPKTSAVFRFKAGAACFATGGCEVGASEAERARSSAE